MAQSQYPQYPQLLRNLALQRLGAGDSAQGTAQDWRMLSHAAVESRRQRVPLDRSHGTPVNPDPRRPPELLEKLKRNRDRVMGGPTPYTGPGFRGFQRAAFSPLAEDIRQRLALKMARTGRPPMVAPQGAADPAKFMRGSMGA